MKRKKINGIILIAVGVLILFLGGFIYFNNNEKKSLLIDTSLFSGDSIDSSSYKSVEYDSLKDAYVNSYNLDVKNKYVFKYPEYLTDKSTSKVRVYLESEDFSISAIGYNEPFKDIYDEIISAYNEDIYKHNIVESEWFSFNEVRAKYLKFTYLYDSNEKDYSEHFYFFLEESDSSGIVFQLNSINIRIPDDMLNEFVENIKIEKNSASYLYGVNNGDTIELSLRQDCGAYDDSYTAILTLPSNKYIEVENENNSIDTTTFSRIGYENSVISVNYFCNNYEDVLNDTIDNLKEYYSNSVEIIEPYLESSVTFNDRVYSKITVKYKISNDIYEGVYLINRNDDFGFYFVELLFDNEVDDSTISDFTNIVYNTSTNSDD